MSSQTVLTAYSPRVRIVVSIERVGSDQLSVSRYTNGQLVADDMHAYDDEGTREAARHLQIAGLMAAGYVRTAG